MKIDRRVLIRVALVLLLGMNLTALSTRSQADCNPNPTPFTDLTGMPSVFCQAVAEAYFSG
jgi:hypothetical protein